MNAVETLAADMTMLHVTTSLVVTSVGANRDSQEMTHIVKVGHNLCFVTADFWYLWKKIFGWLIALNNFQILMNVCWMIHVMKMQTVAILLEVFTAHVLVVTLEMAVFAKVLQSKLGKSI